MLRAIDYRWIYLCVSLVQGVAYPDDDRPNKRVNHLNRKIERRLTRRVLIPVVNESIAAFGRAASNSCIVGDAKITEMYPGITPLMV